MGLMVKLSIPLSISQRSFQASLQYSRFSHLVCWPCFACETAFVHHSASSCYHISFTTCSLFVPSPKPPLPCCTWPKISPSLRVDFACCNASDRFHFLPAATLWAAAYGILSFCQGHVQPYLGTFKFFSKASDRQFQSPIPIQLDIAEASWEFEPFLYICTDCSLPPLNFGDGNLIHHQRPHQTGEQSNLQAQKFQLTWSRVLSMLARPLMVSSSNCLFWSESLRLALYHHPQLLTGISDTIGIGACWT